MRRRGKGEEERTAEAVEEPRPPLLPSPATGGLGAIKQGREGTNGLSSTFRLSPLLWDLPWLSKLSSILLPAHTHEKFEYIIKLANGTVTQEDEERVKIRIDEIRDICVARSSSFEVFIAWVYCMVYMLVVLFVIQEEYFNAIFQLALTTLIPIIIKRELFTIESTLKALMFGAFVVNASMCFQNAGKSEIPPFFGFYGNSMVVLPVLTHYFIRRTWFTESLLFTFATFLACFYASLGKEYSYTFTFSEQFPLFAFGMIIVFIPSLLMSLSEAEKQVYLILLSRQLNQSEDRSEAKSAFIFRMSHELRTPLHGLLSSVELLRQTGVDEEQEEYLSMIHSCGELILDLVFRILDISKIEAGKFERSEAPFSLFEAVGGLARSMAGLAEGKGFELSVSFEPHPEGYDVEGDKGHLLEVLTNFVGNAIKYSDKGVISIRASRGDALEGDGGLVTYRLEVVDQGPGIPKSQQHMIFTPFTQLHASQKSQGTGLGLSITKTIAEALGGQVGLDSEEGQGCKFWVEVPFRPLPPGTFSQPLYTSPLELRSSAPTALLPSPVLSSEPSLVFDLKRDEARFLLISARPLELIERYLFSWGIAFEHAAGIEAFLSPDQAASASATAPGAPVVSGPALSRFSAFIVDIQSDPEMHLARYLVARTEAEAPPQHHERGPQPQEWGSAGPEAPARLRPPEPICYLARSSNIIEARRRVERIGVGWAGALTTRPMDPQEVAKIVLRLMGVLPTAAAAAAAAASIFPRSSASPEHEGPGGFTTTTDLRAEHGQGQGAGRTRARLRTETHPEAGALPPVGPVQVLVVEDNVVNQTIMKKQLERLGISHRICGSGEEALEIWRGAGPSGIPLIFMDAQLDGRLTGLETAQLIRKEELQRQQQQQQQQGAASPRSFITMISGRAGEEDRTEAVKMGCDGFLVKPVGLETIRDMVKRLVHTSPPS